MEQEKAKPPKTAIDWDAIPHPVFCGAIGMSPIATRLGTITRVSFECSTATCGENRGSATTVSLP